MLTSSFVVSHLPKCGECGRTVVEANSIIQRYLVQNKKKTKKMNQEHPPWAQATECLLPLESF